MRLPTVDPPTTRLLLVERGTTYGSGKGTWKKDAQGASAPFPLRPDFGRPSRPSAGRAGGRSTIDGKAAIGRTTRDLGAISSSYYKSDCVDERCECEDQMRRATRDYDMRPRCATTTCDRDVRQRRATATCEHDTRPQRVTATCNRDPRRATATCDRDVRPRRETATCDRDLRPRFATATRDRDLRPRLVAAMRVRCRPRYATFTRDRDTYAKTYCDATNNNLSLCLD